MKKINKLEDFIKLYKNDEIDIEAVTLNRDVIREVNQSNETIECKPSNFFNLNILYSVKGKNK